MNLIRTIPKIEAIGRWDIYEGDVVHRGDGVVMHGLTTVRKPMLSIEEHNLVDTTGKGLLLDRLFGVAGAGAALTQSGVGTSNTAAAVTDTSLTGQVLVVFDSTPTRSGLTVTTITTYPTGTANITWAECGQFNAVPTLFDRIAPIGPFTKTSAVSIVLTFATTQS